MKYWFRVSLAAALFEFTMKIRANILVIDDNAQVRDTLTFLLTKSGHKVSTAANWKGVSEQLEIAKKNQRPFDVILLELVMSDRSGFEMLRDLKKMLEPIPAVIILSYLDDIEEAARAKRLGADKYLTIESDHNLLACKYSMNMRFFVSFIIKPIHVNCNSKNFRNSRHL